MAIQILGEKGIAFQFVKKKIFLTVIKCFVKCKTVTGETTFNKYRFSVLLQKTIFFF